MCNTIICLRFHISTYLRTLGPGLRSTHRQHSYVQLDAPDLMMIMIMIMVMMMMMMMMMMIIIIALVLMLVLI
jgi:hypothetical protein